MNYEALCGYAGDHLQTRWPDPVEVGSGELIPQLSVGVYVALGVDETVLYVGSVCRPENAFGVRARVEEHLRKHERHAAWNKVLLLPLKSDTPLSEVRRIEGRVGAHLRPAMSNALPKLNSPRLRPR